MSPGCWIAFFWLAIIASRPVGYWFVSGTAAADLGTDVSSGSFVDRNTYLALIIVGLIALAHRRINWPSVGAHGKWLWIFYLYLLLSVVWSPYPFVAFKRWFKDTGNVVMVLLILTDDDPLVAVRQVFVRCAYLLIPVSVLCMKYFPDIGRYYNHWTWTASYCGITTSKNALGDSAMVSGLFLLWDLVDIQGVRSLRGHIKRTWPDLVVLAMCLWILGVAESATALTCFILGAVVFFASRSTWVRSNLARLGWYGLGVVLVMLAFTVLPGFRGAVAGVLNRDVTLTGRTVIWERVMDLGINPIFGSGFASAWLTPKGYALADELGIPHAHNGYLETYLHSGWIGVLLLLVVLLSAGRAAARQLLDRTVVGPLFMALFLSGVIYNYTEVAFNDSNIIGFGLWLMAAFGICSAFLFQPASSEVEAGLESGAGQPQPGFDGPIR